jgi:hypothetical protein
MPDCVGPGTETVVVVTWLVVVAVVEVIDIEDVVEVTISVVVVVLLVELVPQFQPVNGLTQ